MSLTYNFCKNYIQIFFVGDQIFENYFSDSFHYYYKSWQLLFSKIGTAFCISNRDRDITNWFSYFKSGQIYYKQGSFYKSGKHYICNTFILTKRPRKTAMDPVIALVFLRCYDVAFFRNWLTVFSCQLFSRKSSIVNVRLSSRYACVFFILVYIP